MVSSEGACAAYYTYGRRTKEIASIGANKMQEKKHYVRPLNIKNGKIEMNYGAGGKASAQLISELFCQVLPTMNISCKAMTEHIFQPLKAT